MKKPPPKKVGRRDCPADTLGAQLAIDTWNKIGKLLFTNRQVYDEALGVIPEDCRQAFRRRLARIAPTT